MFFKKKPPTIPERQRRTAQPPARTAVFSYYASRSPRPNAEARELPAVPTRKTALKWDEWSKHLPVIIGGMFCLVLFVLSVHLDPHTRIVPVDPNKGQVFLRPLREYEAAAAQAFSGVANSNKITVNTEGIAAQLTRQFPELLSVSVSLPFLGSKATVYVQPATPRIILATPSNGVYVLDSSGRALIAANQVAKLGDLQLPVVTDESGLRLQAGQAVLPRSTVSFITEVVQQLQAKKLVASSLTLPVGTSELHVRLPGAGYYVKYNLYGNAREEVGAFLALKERLEQDRKVPKEYIDVRVEGRAYYK